MFLALNTVSQYYAVMHGESLVVPVMPHNVYVTLHVMSLEFLYSLRHLCDKVVGIL